jgi:hypothetical protein
MAKCADSPSPSITQRDSAGILSYCPTWGKRKFELPKGRNLLSSKNLHRIHKSGDNYFQETYRILGR